MQRFAFIDVQNTETTALKVLKFVIDHKKLFSYLKTKWECEKVFFYPGIQNGDSSRNELFENIEKLGALVRPKYYFVYKNSDKILKTNCPNCNSEIVQSIDMGHTWKCNCDVEMTMDILECVGPDTEMLIFTGDGDFESLIQKLVEKNVKVYLVSSGQKLKKGPRYSTSRFATKLRVLISKYPKHIFFLDLNDWKMQIELNELKK